MIKQNKSGFTLVELLVVVAMIGIIMMAMAMSITASMQRARIQKATSDVKVITQAILAYENYTRGELKTMSGADADASHLDFLIGSNSGVEVPALLMAAFQSGNAVRDPWGKPYKVNIRKATENVKIVSASSSLTTGFQLPNYYRLSPEERK